MNIRRLLNIDLAGRLEAQIKRYKANPRIFDHRTIHCNIQKYGPKKFSVTASAFCSDHSVTGYQSTNVLQFYQTNSNFLSRVEAEAHLQAEIRIASSRHSETRFYRTRIVLAPKAEGGIEEANLHEYCINSIWQYANRVPTFRRCAGCGNETPKTICPLCGEPVFG